MLGIRLKWATRALMLRCRPRVQQCSSITPLAPGWMGRARRGRPPARRPGPSRGAARMSLGHQGTPPRRPAARRVQVIRRRSQLPMTIVALRQLGAVVGVAERLDLDPAMRRAGPGGCATSRGKTAVQVVAGGDAEGGAWRVAGSKPRIGEQHLGAAQDAGAGLDHAQPGLGGHHAGRRAHQRRIAGVAQALQRGLTAGWCMPSRMAARRRCARSARYARPGSDAGRSCRRFSWSLILARTLPPYASPYDPRGLLFTLATSPLAPPQGIRIADHIRSDSSAPTGVTVDWAMSPPTAPCSTCCAKDLGCTGTKGRLRRRRLRRLHPWRGAARW